MMCGYVFFFFFFYFSFFFFFKQKTAYEIGVRLVGSEMCIRDSRWTQGFQIATLSSSSSRSTGPCFSPFQSSPCRNITTCPAPLTPWICLLYTSDAADEEDSVDLGGRRIIKKKKRQKKQKHKQQQCQLSRI